MLLRRDGWPSSTSTSCHLLQLLLSTTKSNFKSSELWLWPNKTCKPQRKTSLQPLWAATSMDSNYPP